MKKRILVALAVLFALPASAQITVNPGGKSEPDSQVIRFTDSHAVNTITKAIEASYGMWFVWDQWSDGVVSCYWVESDDDTFAEVEAGTLIRQFTTDTTYKPSGTPPKPFVRCVVDTQETTSNAYGQLTVYRSNDLASGGGSLLEEVAACSANFTKPEGCPSATFVSTQADLEDCFDNADDPVCVLTNTLRIEASDRDSNGATDLEGLYLVKADGDEDPKLVCAPGVEIRVNATTTTGSLELVNVYHGTVGAGDAGSFPGVHGCTVVEYHNGSPGGSARTTEGVVYKNGGGLLTYRQAFEVSDSNVFVYSTGSSSVGVGVNPAAYVDGFYRRNLIYSPLGIDAKIRCDSGCDDAVVLVEDSIILVNETDTTTPRIIKVDDDANVIYQRNVSHGGVIGLDATQSATYDAGVVQLIDSTFSDSASGYFFTQANTLGTQTVYGRGLTFANVNPTSSWWLNTGGLSADVEATYTDCPSGFTNWYDLTGIGANETLGDFRLVVDIPDGCTNSATLISSRGITEIDNENTKAFIKIENRFIEVDGAKTDADGPGVLTGATDKFVTDYGTPIWVGASPSTSYDTGSEVAGHAGYQCLDVYVASSGALLTDGDADGYTCDETISAASIVMVHRGVSP